MTYPRSGTTWLSCIATKLLFDVSPKRLDEIDHYVPDLHMPPPQEVVPPSDFYLVKSHLPCLGDSPFGEYQRVIYLIRDPRDVLLSYYRYSKAQHAYSGSLDAFAQDWVSGRIWPCSWQEHVNSWLGPRVNEPAFHLTVLSYEDLVADPVKSVEQLVLALGLQSGREAIEDAVSDASADKMRDREAAGHKRVQPGFQFIGPAKSGLWREKISEHRAAFQIVEHYTEPTMSNFGYSSECGVL